jgi:hypothetical protein
MPVHPGRETSMHYSSFLRGPGAVFHKKHARTRYGKYLFLHLVKSMGHVVPSGAFGAQNVNALFLMLG